MNRIPPNKTPDAIAEQICEDYHIHTLAYVCQKYCISEPTVVHIYQNKGYVKNKRIHTLNESYFSVIDTPNKAYILGFFMADVTVCKTTKKNSFANRIILNISHKDKYLLQEILTELNSDVKIQDYTPKCAYSTNLMSRIVINSTKMCKDLAQYNIVERRTPIKCIPDNLPAEMMPHFIRGLFDGDGSCITKSNNQSKHITFTSQSFTLLQQLKDLFASLGCISIATIHSSGRGKNAFQVQWSYIQDIQIWYDYMYPEGQYLYLHRKREKFLT